MKLFMLGSLLFTGGSAVAMQNETLQQEVTNTYNQVKEMVQKGFRGSMIERVKEDGFPYPNDTLLSQLTEEQATLYLTAIDQINATYDWQNMSDEEIQEALAVIKVEMTELREELGIEVLQVQTQARKGRKWSDDFTGGRHSEQNGTGECLYNDVE